MIDRCDAEFSYQTSWGQGRGGERWTGGEVLRGWGWVGMLAKGVIQSFQRMEGGELVAHVSLHRRTIYVLPAEQLKTAPFV